jgi:hypothetical protein
MSLLTRPSFAKFLICTFIFILSTTLQASDEELKPFVLAYTTDGANIESVAAEVSEKLKNQGFEIAGKYSPYDGATIIIITNDELKQAAAKSEFGGYAAAQRVSITKVDEEFQVAYTNPTYMAYAYRMKSDLSAVSQQLQKALGKEKEYGPETGLTPKKLQKYHYMFGMEYFNEPSELAEYKSYDQAITKVEQALKEKKGGVSKVYRIDIPGKPETVFGVHMTQDCSSDEFIMHSIDFKPIRSTAHLPYEMLVSKNKVYALYARFRIAINFPDLKMIGSNSFFKIMCAPDAIENALRQAAGVEEKKEDNNF